jgi:hypothetical protein
MNRIPGFTADLSEGKSPHHYAGGAAIQSGHVNAVVSQLWRDWGDGWGPGEDCNPSCACLWPNGCPCCIGPGPGGWSQLPVAFER